MHFAKTRPLILETLSQGNQKPTRDWRGERSWVRPPVRSFGWLHYVLYSTGSCQNSKHTPNWLKYNKHIPGPSENDLWIISPIWLFMPPLPFLGLDGWNLYALRGAVYRWVSIGADESWWEGQWTRASDEVLVLVQSLNLSRDSGKSLHPWLLPHPGGANTSELNSLSQGYRYCLQRHGKCKACQVKIQVQSQHPWVNLWGNSSHIKSMLFFSRVKISSKERLVPVTTENKLKSHTELQKNTRDGKTPRHAHFFHGQFDLAPMNTQRTQKVHCTLITFLGI